jgi:hypothetical protein
MKRKGTYVKVGQLVITNITDDCYLTRQARARGHVRLLWHYDDPEDWMTGRVYSVEEVLNGEYKYTDNYARMSAKEMRKALDAVTLEEAPEATVDVNYPRFSAWTGKTEMIPLARDGKGRRGKLVVRLGNGGSRIRITAPCGETRVYSLKTLDKALSEFGA